MAIYINGIGIISALDKNEDGNSAVKFFNENRERAACVEPDYSSYIDLKAIRRMSRIIKMGVTSSFISLKDAGLDKPDAIIVGTALGCLEDTVSFLNKLVINKEELLNPTAFIHSTHNTIASQIALNVKCMGYNSTYVHRNISFETALIDAMMLLKEKSVETALVGGIDELTEESFNILKRLGYYKSSEEVSIQAANFAGEGSAFYTLSNNITSSTYAELKSVRTISFANNEKVGQVAQSMLGAGEVELILSGFNNEGSGYPGFYTGSGNHELVFPYKQLCGEYPTSTAFAMSLAAEILKKRKVPEFLNSKIKTGSSINRILIHNNFKDVHHSLILLSAC